MRRYRAISALELYAQLWGFETPNQTVRHSPLGCQSSFDQSVGGPATYVQVSRETKGRRGRSDSAFELPDQG